MRYRGSRHRQIEEPAAEPGGGRHRRSGKAADEGERAPSGTSAYRARHLQPRDAFGRFRRPAADEERPAGRRADATAADVPIRPHYTWRDFELDDEPPHAASHPPDAPDLRDGRRHCGALEPILYRQWPSDGRPVPPDIVRAIDGLASLPDALKDRLAAELNGIYVGPGGVPDLDDMRHLRGEPLPSGRATWDICAGAYGDRTVVVGDRPSPTPDVMMHEIGHALDDIDGRMTDGARREWQSDSAEFRALYAQCLPHLASEFHRQAEDLGRREFFADAFAAIASRQRPALVDMLGGNTRTALNVMLFFNRRYGI